MRTRNKAAGRPLPLGLEMIFEDRDILVVSKPAGLLTISTDRGSTRTAYFLMTDYVRKGNPKSRNRIFVVHRLDRETSGILMFAKNEEAKLRLQENWDDTTKKYLAVVHGKAPKRASLSSYLDESSVHMVRVTRDSHRGRFAQTEYRLVKQTKSMALLEVDLLTGRKHQIRVHLAEAGLPIVGDKKYGLHDEPHSRLALHASSVSFAHPMTGQRLTLEAKPPSYFESLVGRWDED